MEWVKPEILWGLAALIIPVLIHLLHLRRFRKVAFSNVSFLADVKKETRSKHRLRNLIILLLRLIAIAAIVSAFADPYIPFSDHSDHSSGNGNAISIYIDTSPSMQAVGEEGPILQVEKTRASEIVEQYSETDKFHVLTNTFSGRDSHFLNKDEALEVISTIKSGPFVRSLKSVVSRATDQLNKAFDKKRTLYILSDLQKTTHQFSESFRPDTNLTMYFLPSLANDRPNVWIDSAWFDASIATSSQPAVLHVRLKHNALQKIDGLGLELHINDERKAIGSFNLIPGLPTDTVLRYTHDIAGFYHATLSIDDAPIQFDDTYRLGYEVVEKISVLQLTPKTASPESNSVNRVFNSNHDALKYETSSTLPDATSLNNYDLIVVNGIIAPSSGQVEALYTFASKGGTVIIIPDSSTSTNRSNILRTRLGFGSGLEWHLTDSPEAISYLKLDHPLFDGVFSSTPTKMDLPSTDRVLSRKITPEEEILGTMGSGLPFLSRVPLNSGQVFLFSSPLARETGNLVSHALFVPLLLRMTESARSAKVWAITLGKDLALNIDVNANADKDIRIISQDGETVILPETRTTDGTTRLLLGPSLNTPGNYWVTVNKIPVLAFGVNADRTESDPIAWDIPSFREELINFSWSKAQIIEVTNETISSVIGSLDTGTHLWWYLIIVVIIALAGETLLQKRWKKTYS